MTKITNLKIRLLGSVHADLDDTKSASKASTVTDFDDRPQQSSFTNGMIEMTCASVTLEDGEKALCSYFLTSGYSNNNQNGGMTHNLQRDGQSIADFTHGNYNGPCLKYTAQYVDDPGAGTYVYRIVQTEISDLGNYQFIFLKVNVIKSVDTHSVIDNGVIQ